MSVILTRGGILLCTILLGQLLKRIRFLPENAFQTLAKIILNITLPCIFITNLSKVDMAADLLWMIALGFCFDAVYIGVAVLAGRKKGTDELILNLLNFTGYNIGCFTLPFITGMLGIRTVVAILMFDVGNAIWANEGTNAVCMAIQEGKRRKLSSIVLHLFTRPAFIVSTVMPVLSLLRIRLPGPVLQLAELAGSANSFLSMLLIGLGISLQLDRKHLRWIGKAFLIRFGIAAVFAALIYRFLPFGEEIRLGAMLAAFAPVSAMSVVHSERRGVSVETASTWNTLSILCSMAFMMLIIRLAGAA